MKKIAFFILFYFFANSLFSQTNLYTNCDSCWNADSLGNHRVVVHVDDAGKLVKAILPWRRNGHNPQDKALIIEDAATHEKVMNIKAVVLNRESGIVYFEPTSGKGDYYIYYQPYKNEGRSNYPQGIYLKPENTASPDWLNLLSDSNKAPLAKVISFQSIDGFNTYDPMEIIATKAETNSLISQNVDFPYLIFPEDRMHPIRMTADLPQRWISQKQGTIFRDTAAKGDNFSFQLGLFALKDIRNVRIQFSDLKNKNGQIISSKTMSCLNTSGIDYTGLPIHPVVNINAGKIQPLWCLVDIPENINPGIYKGSVTILSDQNFPKTQSIELVVKNETASKHGVNEPWKMTRLKWLNSTMAQENSVIAPYIPLKVNKNEVSLLGRKVTINKDGFPLQIQTYFNPEMTSITSLANKILEEGIHFHFKQSSDGKDIVWKNEGLRFTDQQQGIVRWAALNRSKDLEMTVNAALEFDGFISYSVKVIALHDIELSNISMHIPFAKTQADYLMGLGQKGGLRKDTINWKWDVAHKNQDGAWIGNVNAGLEYSLRDEKYVRPLNTNFYLNKPLLLPSSWGNGNKGGITIAGKGNSILADNFSGPRGMKKGDSLFFNFTLLITPFHTINTDFQWANRFYHSYARPDSVKASGATLINIHHANAINPWINYPFIEWKKMKRYIDSAHTLGLKVKIYNTIRELSNHAYETFALKSLGHEIYSAGKGGGFSWLQEHMDSDYIPAWFVPGLKDAAIINSGMNRWHNYYVEGMNWLTQNVGIDGIYLDDVAFDRVTMKRIKRVLTRDGHPGIIDLHSANQYNERDGYNNSANLYMEHFPYLNRLWFGEYFDYENNDPDFFLTEVSGIPFGLMGEMLEKGGNPWRGMIYGMTNRMPWSDNADPRPIWKVWDQFGMKGTEMIGYWSPNCPVKTDHEKVLATVYKKKGAALISIASWADTDVEVQLQIDWKRLGLEPNKATIEAPEINHFQSQQTFKITDKIMVPKGKGWLLIIKEK